MKAPIPVNEAERLDALEKSGVDEGSEHPELAGIAAEAAALARTPFAAVSFISDRHQWVKASVGELGVEADDRDTAFCAWALHSQEITWVEDAATDPRFLDNPLVTSNPGIRHYAGAPIATPDGYLLGTVCVVDMAPRPYDAELAPALRTLASRVSEILFAEAE